MVLFLLKTDNAHIFFPPPNLVIITPSKNQRFFSVTPCRLSLHFIPFARLNRADVKINYYSGHTRTKIIKNGKGTLTIGLP